MKAKYIGVSIKNLTHGKVYPVKEQIGGMLLLEEDNDPDSILKMYLASKFEIM